MKIVYVGNYPLDSSCIFGGVEASVYGLAQEMAKTHEVLVADIPRMNVADEIVSDGEVVVKRFENKGNKNSSATARVKEMQAWILEQHPDVCHFHGTGSVVRLLYFALKKRGVNILLTVHGLAHVEKRNALRKGFSFKKLLQYIYQSVDEFSLLSECPRIVVDTEYVKNAIIGYKKQRKIRRLPEIDVVPQGIDEGYFEHKCSLDSGVVLSVGAFTSRKGHLLLLKAFDQLADCIPSAKLVIAGTVADTSYFEKMKDYVSQSKHQDRISLFSDVDKKKLMSFYESASLFALHTEEESQGIVFAEAMAMGLPIVSTRVGGVPFVVEQGENGFLSDYLNVEEFASNMKCLLADDSFRMGISLKCRTQAEKYRWSVASKCLANIYSQL